MGRLGAVGRVVQLTGLGLVGWNVVELIGVKRRAKALRQAHEVTALVPGPGPGGDAAAEPIRLVTLGDSVMEGDGILDPGLTLPRCLAQGLAERRARPVLLTQLGVSGATTADVLADQIPRLRDLRPDVIVLSVGVNDGLRRHRLERIERGHHQIAEALAAVAPDVPVALVAAPDLRRAPALPWPGNHAIGTLTGRVASRQERWLAHTPIVVVPVGTPDTDFGPDGFHPGPTGTPTIAAWVLDALDEAARNPDGRHATNSS